ncbi:MAG TPA: COX15/CtaA family protein [Longimicrobiales bacterium]|nr:COX15/CtaA family protein [Longimicrobiales bacterium]
MKSTAPTSGTADSAADWRQQIPGPRRRALRAWLWSIAATTFAVMVVGGITRLTQSGLSIVDWQPIMGVIPPLNEAQWQEAFDRYRQFPEYQVLRRGMTMDEFRFIFFWEYLHRVLARVIGLVFLVPFAWFAVRRYFNRELAVRALLLFGLGAAQGLMGWLMVASGLVDRPSVSHFRLAAHLSLAFIIFAACVWLVRELRSDFTPVTVGQGVLGRVRRGVIILGVLLGLQIVWGAFVAGLKAGFLYNTFPLMGGRLVPVDLLAQDGGVANFVNNAIAVQWLHRVMGTVLAVWAVVVAAQVRRWDTDANTRRLATVMAAGVLAQYGLGILTLVYRVPVSLGVIHQAAALVLLGVWAWWVHHLWRIAVPAHTSVAA